MSLRDEIYDILDAEDNPEKAAKKIMGGPKTTTLYCIQLGLEFLVSRRRATKRRELRAIVQPEFIKPSGSAVITGRVVLTKKAKQRIIDNARELFSGWMINATITLGNATREDLEAQAIAEETSALGNLRNAQFYRALMEPLTPGQRAGDYWSSKEVQKLKNKIWDKTENQRPALY